MGNAQVIPRSLEHQQPVVVCLSLKLDSTVGQEVPFPGWELVAGGNFDLPGFRGFAFSALGLSGLVLGIWWFRTGPRTEPSRAQLVAALGPSRLSEGRFSGGFQYAPSQGSVHNQLYGKSLIRIYRQFESELERRPTQDVLAGFAVLNLAFGKVDEAFDLFNQLARRQPERAEALSDLAAFWLARAHLSQDPFDLIRALDAADRAVRLNSDLPEAWFNLAVAQERLFLPRAAARAWTIYLSLDDNSAWAWEARARLFKAREPTERQIWNLERIRLEQAVLDEDEATIEAIVHRFPLPARLWVEEELFPRWAEAELTGTSSTSEILLRGAGRVAACHKRVTGDTTLPDSVEAIENSRGVVRSELARGHILFGAGRKAYVGERLEEAEKQFRQARGAFNLGHSPFALWNDLAIAVCRLEVKDFVGALSRLDTLLRLIEPNRHRALAARAHWIRGMTQFARGEPTLSLRDFEHALVYLSGTRATEDEGAIHYLVAANLSYLGEPREAWRHLYQALAATPRTIQARRLFTAFDEAGTMLEKAGEFRAALYFRDATIIVSRVSGHSDPTGLGHAYLRRAESSWKVGDEENARADLRQARMLAGRIDTKGFRDAALAKVNVAEAEVLAVSSPQRALELLDDSLAYYLRLGSYFDLPRIFLGRYYVLRNMGRLTEAVLELERGIHEYEQVRERVVDEGTRISYFDQAHQLFGIMMKFQEEIGRPDAALWYAERERSRDLLDLRVSANNDGRLIGSRPFTPQELKAQIPKGVVLVEYAVLDDRLLAWVVRRGSISPFSLDVSSSELSSWVHAIRDDLASEDRHGRLKPNLEKLYDRIIRPFDLILESADSVVFVPDGPLLGLPFAALRDHMRDRYLIESRIVSVSPSASLYIMGSVADENELSVNRSVLAMGASDFDRRAFDRLASLSQAEAEAETVASVYSRSSLFVGKTATREQFLDGVGKYEVIHFAGHTIAVPELPSSPMMIFAPSNDLDSGILRGTDLYRINMKKTRVVVLSSCGSGLGSKEGSEIGFGLVRPFLASGVDAVASLWDVPDARARELIVSLHKNLSMGMETSQALRQSQINLIHSSNPNWASPSLWAVLQNFGTAR